VELGDAWNPFFTAGALTTTSRTLDMAGEADLAEGIAYLKAQSEQMGRAKPPAIILGNLFAPGETSSAAAFVDRIGACAALGATGAATHIEGNTRAEWCDNAERFAKEVIAKLP
jgi:hypothetical protein